MCVHCPESHSRVIARLFKTVHLVLVWKRGGHLWGEWPIQYLALGSGFILSSDVDVMHNMLQTQVLLWQVGHLTFYKSKKKKRRKKHCTSGLMINALT